MSANPLQATSSLFSSQFNTNMSVVLRRQSRILTTQIPVFHSQFKTHHPSICLFYKRWNSVEKIPWGRNILLFLFCFFQMKSHDRHWQARVRVCYRFCWWLGTGSQGTRRHRSFRLACVALTHCENKSSLSAGGVTNDSTDICCTAQHRNGCNASSLKCSQGFGWKSFEGCVCVVKEWFLCTQGFVQRWGRPRGWRRCWLFVGGGFLDGAWTVTSWEHHSSEDEDPLAHASWDCPSCAGSSSAQWKKGDNVTNTQLDLWPNWQKHCIVKAFCQVALQTKTFTLWPTLGSETLESLF